MDWETILASLVAPAIIALWVFWKERTKEQDKFKRERSADQDEHLQQSQSDSLKQVISLNEKLIENLISMSNGRFTRLNDNLVAVNERQGQLGNLLAEIKSQQQIVVIDWSRINEIVGDIDIEMHEIKSALHAQGIRSNSYRQRQKQTKELSEEDMDI